MEKSANEVMQEAMVAAVLDAIVAWKAASGGLPNVLARDLGAVHPNTTLDDLPKEVQAALREATRGAFNRLMKQGFTVAKGGAVRPAQRPAPDGRGQYIDTSRPGGKPRPRSDRRPGKPPVVETKRGPRGPRPGGSGPKR